MALIDAHVKLIDAIGPKGNELNDAEGFHELTPNTHTHTHTHTNTQHTHTHTGAIGV